MSFEQELYSKYIASTLMLKGWIVTLANNSDHLKGPF